MTSPQPLSPEPSWTSVLEAVTGATMVSNATNTLLHINTACQTLLDWPLPPRPGHALGTLFQANSDQFLATERLLALLESNASTSTPLLLEYHDGRTMEVSVRSLGSAPHHRLWHWLDVTRRERASRVLRVIEERYGRATRAGRVGVWDWNRDTDTLFVDVNLKTLLGFADFEISLRPRPWLALMPADDRHRLLAAVRRCLGDGGHFQVEHRIRSHSGEWRWFLSQGEYLLSRGQWRLVGTSTEITAHKRDQRFFETLIDRLPDPLFIKDRQHRYLLVNAAFRRLHDCEGLSPSQLDDYHLYDPDEARLSQEHDEQVFHHGRESTREVVYIDAGGIGHSLSVKKALLSNDNRPHLIGIVRNVTEARHLAQQMHFQASHDSLTGLVNRREFEARLRQVLEHARHAPRHHALCYIDLDQFKVINDTCGHGAGDELLRQLADLLQQGCEPGQTLARLGGDEFGLLLEDTSLEQAEAIGRQLLRVVENFHFAWDNRVFKIGASIGLVTLDTLSGDMTQVLSAADRACYMAKEQGRNRLHRYREDDTQLNSRQQQMQWVARIPQALDQNRFQLYFQTIASIGDHGDSGHHYELLIRMKDDEGTLLPPGAFLGVTERYNLIGRLDRWVVRHYLHWLQHHPQHLAKLHLAAINLSGHSLSDEAFLIFVVEQFQETGIPPDRICFEITETTAISNLSYATHFIRTLTTLGCRFALDDFGSGISSFAYLKKLPVDYLKIDGMFVRDIVDDPIDRAMVRSIHEIGQLMGKRTVAEFVESEAILDCLREIGVDYAQGYHLGRPSPLDNLLD